MDMVRIGFIGAGGIAGRHVSDLLRFEDVTIAAVADPVEERAQAQAARCNANAYTDYAAMLDRETLDAVYICVPPFAHGPLERAAVERRLPFFVEKPLACDWQTAVQIEQAVRACSLVTAVGYHWRYLDTVEEAQARLAANPAALVLGYWLDATPPPAWWRKEQESGGQMVEQTTHIFDVARVLVGDVTTVYATGARRERGRSPMPTSVTCRWRR